MAEHGDRQSDIEARAAQWVIRLGGDPLEPDERGELDRWLEAHPDHRAAFDRACATWADLGQLRAAPGSLDDRSRARNHPHQAVLRSAPRRRSPAWIGTAAVAASLLVVVGLVSFWFDDPVTLLTADHRTAPAEIRTIELPDGSLLDLGPASAIALRFDDRERRIELLSGVAYVTAAPMEGSERRPFVVEAATGMAAAIGTQFAVDRLPDKAVRVAVAEHRVEVHSTRGRGEEAVVLSAGQAVHYDEAGGLGPVESAAVEQLTAWRRGRLIFDRVPLADVVAELNRYRRGRIVIADAALAGRTVSGVFETAKLDDALESIARELGAETAAVPPFLTVLY